MTALPLVPAPADDSSGSNAETFANKFGLTRWKGNSAYVGWITEVDVGSAAGFAKAFFQELGKKNGYRYQSVNESLYKAGIGRPTVAEYDRCIGNGTLIFHRSPSQ